MKSVRKQDPVWKVWKVHPCFLENCGLIEVDIWSSKSQGRRVLCHTLERLRMQSYRIVLECEVGACLLVGDILWVDLSITPVQGPVPNKKRKITNKGGQQ